MSLDFSFHRRKRSFPFSLFGLTAALGMAVVLIIHSINESAFVLLNISDNGFVYSKLIAYILMITSFLSFMLSLGLISRIVADFKFVLHISSFFVFIFVFLSGYFIDFAQFDVFISSAVISTIVYEFLLVIFFLVQRRISSSYNSRIMMMITVLPLIPLVYAAYRIFTIGIFEYISFSIIIDTASFALMILLLYISLLANSIYLIYISRKVR